MDDWSVAAFAVAFASALTGCSTTMRDAELPYAERIEYSTGAGPFCGRCDSIKLIILSAGRGYVEHGHWAGNYARWTKSRRTIAASPEQFASFRKALEQYRPNGVAAFDGPPNCATLTDDLPEVWVTWTSEGRTDEIMFHFGCDLESKSAMREALRDAPALLGIASPLSPPGRGSSAP